MSLTRAFRLATTGGIGSAGAPTLRLADSEGRIVLFPMDIALPAVFSFLSNVMCGDE